MTQPEKKHALIRPRHCANGTHRQSACLAGTMDVVIEPDPVTGTFQWFCFRLRAPEGVAVRLVNAGQSTYPAGWSHSVAWARGAGQAWRPLPLRFSGGIASFTHGCLGESATYALFPPYPQARLDRLAGRALERADADVVAADTNCGSALRISIGDRDPKARQIWVVGGQHGGEHPAMWFADGLLDALLTRRELPAGIRFHVVPVANPAGMLAGHLRTNAQGQDPNRSWGRPGDCREVQTLQKAMARTGMDMLIDVHTDFEMGCVYLDVLDEWMETPARLTASRERFERNLAARSPDMVYGKRYPWTSVPGADMLAGMCAPAMERRFDAAAITLELPVGLYEAANGERKVWSPRSSRALGRAAAAALFEG